MSTDVVLPTDPIAEQPKRSWIRRMFALIDRARRRFVREWDSSMSLRTAVIAAAATIIGSLFLAFFLTQQITNGLFQSRFNQVQAEANQDRKSTRLNSSHVAISYAVFCLKKKNKDQNGYRHLLENHD